MRSAPLQGKDFEALRGIALPSKHRQRKPWISDKMSSALHVELCYHFAFPKVCHLSEVEAATQRRHLEQQHLTKKFASFHCKHCGQWHNGTLRSSSSRKASR
jgi:hypothetical protein